MDVAPSAATEDAGRATNLLSRSIAWYKSLPTERRLILALLAIFFLRGFLYATIIPIWQAPDEPEHFYWVQYWVNKLAPFAAGQPIGVPFGMTDQNSPYNWLIALPFSVLFAGARVWWKVVIVRLVSVGLATGTVYFVYRLAKEVMPENRYVAFGSAAFVALLPQFTHISASVNGDNLANLAGAIILFLAVSIIRRGVNPKRVVALVAAVVLAVLAKRTTAFLIPPLVLVLPPMAIFRQRDHDVDGRVRLKWLASWAVCLVAALPMAASLSTGLIPTNVSDVTRALVGGYSLESINALLGTMKDAFSPTTAAKVVTLVSGAEVPVFKSFWGYLGWLSIPFPEPYYVVLLTLTIAGLAGVVIYFVTARDGTRGSSRNEVFSVLFLLVAAALDVYVTGAYGAKGQGDWIQGRYIFPALGAIAVLMAMGWNRLLGVEQGRALFVGLVATMALLDAFLVMFLARPLYYTTFPGVLNNGGLIYGQHLTKEVGQATATARPFLFEMLTFYVLLMILYMWMLVDWARDVVSGKELSSETSRVSNVDPVGTEVGLR